MMETMLTMMMMMTNHDYDDDVPLHDLPSSDRTKPVLQLQIYVPCWLLHRCWHPPLETLHSSTSAVKSTSFTVRRTVTDCVEPKFRERESRMFKQPRCFSRV